MDEEPQGPSPDEVRAARNKAIGEYFRNNTAGKTAEKFGLSVIAIRKIAAEQGVKKEKGAPKYENEEEKEISPTHQKVGFRFYSFITLERVRTNAEAAEELGWSPQKVSAIGKGHYQLSLLDLEKIAQYMGKPLAKLFENL